MCSCTIQWFTCPETWHHIYGLSSRLKVDMGCWWLPSGKKHITQLSDMSSCLLLQLVSYPVLMFFYIFLHMNDSGFEMCVCVRYCLSFFLPLSVLFPFPRFFPSSSFCFSLFTLLRLSSFPIPFLFSLFPVLFLSSSFNNLSFSFPLLFLVLSCFFPQVQNHVSWYSTLQKCYPFWEQGKTKKFLFDIFWHISLIWREIGRFINSDSFPFSPSNGLNLPFPTSVGKSVASPSTDVTLARTVSHRLFRRNCSRTSDMFARHVLRMECLLTLVNVINGLCYTKPYIYIHI